MSALFWKKKSPIAGGKTFLVVDVENGSVASGLAYLSSDGPKLFGEKRLELPLARTISSEQIARDVERALGDALAYTSEVAAYLRIREETAAAGALSGAIVFLSAPWVSLGRGSSGLRWEFEPEFALLLHRVIESHLPPHRISFHPFGRAAAHAADYLTLGVTLVVNVTGEVAELLLCEKGKALARATIPLGRHLFMRTLRSHALVSLPEARSALSLAHESDAHPYQEPLDAAARDFAEVFSDGVQSLLGGPRPGTILVVAPEHAPFLARALAAHLDGEVVGSGTVVRALGLRHLEPHVAAHETTRDVPLMLETLFISGQKSRGAGV